MTARFILEGHTAVPCEDLMEWGRWYEDNRPALRVGDDDVNGVRVSTVFLGLDHSFGEGLPLLFETMIFKGPHDGWQDRYTTWEEAELGHKRIVQLLQASRIPTSGR